MVRRELLVVATVLVCGAGGAAGAPTQVPQTDAPEAATRGYPLGASDPDVAETTLAGALLDIETRLNALKVEIFRASVRMAELERWVLQEEELGSKAILIFRNEVGGAFRLMRAHFSLDGDLCFSWSANSEADAPAAPEWEIFAGVLPAGEHHLAVSLEYAGHGFGIFSYVKGYDFKVKSSYTLALQDGKETRLQIIASDSGSITTGMQERLTVRYVASETATLKDVQQPPVEPPTPSP